MFMRRVVTNICYFKEIIAICVFFQTNGPYCMRIYSTYDERDLNQSAKTVVTMYVIM